MRTVRYRLTSSKVITPVRIALITDLHSARYGHDQEGLIQPILSHRPDCLLLGGDLFDHRVPWDNPLIFLQHIARRLPTYYVTGNHEYYRNNAQTIKKMVAFCGGIVLAGDCQRLELQNQTIQICGADDPYAIGVSATKAQIEKAQAQLDPSLLSVLLNHRPELAEFYRTCSFDIVAVGHAHGGQWRIPFWGRGVFAPQQGIFPPYTGGVYDLSPTKMVVSRGLAKIYTTKLPRLFNPTEWVLIEVVPK